MVTVSASSVHVFQKGPTVYVLDLLESGPNKLPGLTCSLTLQEAIWAFPSLLQPLVLPTPTDPRFERHSKDFRGHCPV